MLQFLNFGRVSRRHERDLTAEVFAGEGTNFKTKRSEINNPSLVYFTYLSWVQRSRVRLDADFEIETWNYPRDLPTRRRDSRKIDTSLRGERDERRDERTRATREHSFLVSAIREAKPRKALADDDFRRKTHTRRPPVINGGNSKRGRLLPILTARVLSRSRAVCP